MGSSSSRTNEDVSHYSSAAAAAEEVLSKAFSLVNTSRRLIKEMNEAQYSVYAKLGGAKRLSRLLSIETDIGYFLCRLEEEHKSGGFSLEETLYQQARSLQFLVDFVGQSTYSSAETIVQSIQLIEQIEVLEKREKAALKQNGLRRKLDVAQNQLYEASNALQNFVQIKLQRTSIHSFDQFAERINSIIAALLREQGDDGFLRVQLPQSLRDFSLCNAEDETDIPSSFIDE